MTLTSYFFLRTESGIKPADSLRIGREPGENPGQTPLPYTLQNLFINVTDRYGSGRRKDNEGSRKTYSGA